MRYQGYIADDIVPGIDEFTDRLYAEASFTDPTGTDQVEQAAFGLLQLVGDLNQLILTAYEGGYLDRKVDWGAGEISQRLQCGGG